MAAPRPRSSPRCEADEATLFRRLKSGGDALSFTAAPYNLAPNEGLLHLHSNEEDFVMSTSLAKIAVAAGVLLGALALGESGASAMPTMDQGVMGTATAAQGVEKAHGHRWHHGHRRWHHRHRW